MATAILQFIAKFAAGQAIDAIKKHLYKPDTVLLDTIIGGFDKLEQLIKTLDYENKLWEPMNKIEYWTDRITIVVNDLNSEDNAEHREAYNRVIEALKSESDGIRYQTFSIYAVLMNEKSPLTPNGLLKFWADEAYKKLADENNVKYHTLDYVQELDASVAAVAILLQLGMQLSMYISSTEKDAETFRAQAEDRVKSFCDTLYKKLYPPALRQIKTSYDDPGAWLTNNRWFNLYEEAVTSNKNFLAIHHYWIREISIHTPRGDNSVKLNAFRFAVSSPEKSLGPLEMHAYLDDRKKTRVLFYDGRPAGSSRTFAYTNTESRDTAKVLFKLIPIQVDGDTQRTPLKLIPYQESGGSRTKADNLNTWGITWRLAPTSSPL